MPDPVQMPVSLQPGQNARSTAPHALSASDQGAEAPFARSLAHLLRGAGGLSSQQDSSASGGTDLPLPDQILPPDGQAEPVTWRGQAGLGRGRPATDSLTTATGLPLLSGQRHPGAPALSPADAALLNDAQRADRPLASQQVLEDSQRVLPGQRYASTAAEGGALPSGLPQENALPSGQSLAPGAQQGQAAEDTVARRLAADQSVGPGLSSEGESLRGTGNGMHADPGMDLRTLNGAGESGSARTAGQALSDRPGERPQAWEEGIVQRQRGEGSQVESATQPLAVAATSAGDTAAQSQSVASTGGVPRSANADSSDRPGRALDAGAVRAEPPAWQSGRSSEPLELASSVAGDRLQRFAEQWSSQMNERGGQSAWHANGAGTPSGASGQAAGSLSVGSESAGPASQSAAQTPSASTPSAAAQGSSMPPLPSLTTMPGSAVDAAIRGARNPDAALAGSREAFGSGGAGTNSARDQWGDALSQRISLMTARNQSEARIQLDPPELGRLMIQIQVNSDQASVSFTSPHAVVRDALEASVPRLQDMLSEQGLDLLDVDISDQSQQQADGDSENEPSLLAGADDSEGDSGEAASPLVATGGMSLVDDYV